MGLNGCWDEDFTKGLDHLSPEAGSRGLVFEYLWKNNYLLKYHIFSVKNNNCIIPPASGDRWSRAFVKSSTQHPFNPISSNSPGGGVYPSSFPPPQALEWWFRAQPYPQKSNFFAILVIIIFSWFSNILLYRFWLHFGCELGAKIALKSIESRSQEWSGKPATFSITRSSNFAGFGTPQNLESRAPVSTGS